MQRLISSYTVISATDLIDFVAHINKAINEGWQPYGSPFISSTGGTVGQAMVQYMYDHNYSDDLHTVYEEKVRELKKRVKKETGKFL